ncbi:unnamed protein product [Protopolystoma xenopodis]|uniref:Uncharacterized protein n=1 Tax=Protopolystoma xenopodis TaxID=117903 RepID=A0A448X2S5_9PLAT|nr:unnamed protein product [Protopolystoma xenopodis]
MRQVKTGRFGRKIHPPPRLRDRIQPNDPSSELFLSLNMPGTPAFTQVSRQKLHFELNQPDFRFSRPSPAPEPNNLSLVDSPADSTFDSHSRPRRQAAFRWCSWARVR